MKKKLVIILLILLIIFNIYYIYTNELKTNKYIIFDNNNLFYLKDNYLKKQNSNKLKTLNFSDSKLYSNDINYDYISFNIDTVTYLYDDSNEKIDLHDSYVLTNLNYNLNVKNPIYIESISKEDENNINKVLKNKEIYISLDEIIVSKSKINLSSSGDKATIYNVMSSNETENPNSIYIIFAIINDNIIVIDENITPKEESFTVFNPSLYLTLDINNDKKDEIVISNDKFSSPDSTYYCVYKYNNSSGKFDLISDCKQGG